MGASSRVSLAGEAPSPFTGAHAEDHHGGDEERPFTVLVAMGANLSIAVAKFVVAALAGSAAMFAEGVHSLVDTLNQALLLLGAKRSRRAADESHPFGYGKEVYFWSLIYSVLLFGIGGGVSVYKGVSSLMSPEPIEGFFWNYAVLGIALLAEGSSWLVAYRALRREEGGKRLWSMLRNAKDPSRFVVVGEDSAAVVGLAIAFVGVLCTQLTGSPHPDSIASILIGLVLCAAAVALTVKSMVLLVGQAASPEVVREMQAIVSDSDAVQYATAPLTMYLGPGQAMAAINVKFRRQMNSVELARAVDALETAIRRRFPEFTRIYVEAQVEAADAEREQPHG